MVNSLGDLYAVCLTTPDLPLGPEDNTCSLALEPIFTEVTRALRRVSMQLCCIVHLGLCYTSKVFPYCTLFK